MKKTALLAVALATCLGYVPAQAAEVVSSNIVGYNKVTLTKGYNMLSPMFTYVGGGDKAIVDLFEEKDGFVAADTDAEADYISIWVDGGYASKYFFSSDAGDKWSDEGFEETDDLLPENVGFWFYSRAQAPKTVTLAGEVATEDVDVEVLQGYNMLANPFAAPLPVKSIVEKTGTFVSSDTDAGADYISIWRNGGYDSKYFYSSDAGDKWSDEGFEETEDTIGPGEAFWFYRRGGTMTLTIPAPYDL